MRNVLAILAASAALGSGNRIMTSTLPAAPDHPDHYQWHQMIPLGQGSQEQDWRPGKWPMGIPANIAFDGLWMVGQKWAWSSPDGLTWTGYPKKDWGERISISYFVFDNKLWGAGGMMYDQPQTGFLNDIWNSADGKEWLQVCEKAEWQPRRSPRIITFRNRLWLFGGAIESDAGKGPRHFLNDVWSSQDGIKWRQMTGATNWDPRSPGHILVFKDRLWMIGSDGNTEIWRSDDGVSWVQVASQTPWRTRAAYGTMVFDDKIWVYGGWVGVNQPSALNDMWYSADGVHWRQLEQVPWSPRIPWSSIVFKNKLWIFGGKAGHHQGDAGDVWALSKE